jgi:hypothetical protein
VDDELCRILGSKRSWSNHGSVNQGTIRGTNQEPPEYKSRTCPVCQPIRRCLNYKLINAEC